MAVRIRENGSTTRSEASIVVVAGATLDSVKTSTTLDLVAGDEITVEGYHTEAPSAGLGGQCEVYQLSGMDK